MHTFLDCYPCFLRQALDAARLAGANDVQQKAILDHVLVILQQSGLSNTPPEIGYQVHQLVRQYADFDDPYLAPKQASTQQALALYPRLKEMIHDAADPLDTALRLSIAGNIVDFGPAQQYRLWDVVERVLAQPFAVDDRAAFRSALASVERVLYLADNAGETVFDRLLIETMSKPVVYVVKGGPILNDATMQDALEAGLDAVAEIVSNGSNAPGTILSLCSDEFRQRYAQAEMVIAKGQANYETLSEARDKVFLLLQTKCPVISRNVGVPVRSIVLKQGRGL